MSPVPSPFQLRLRKLAIGLLAGGTILLFLPRRAEACSPIPGSEPAPIGLHSVLAQVVVVGTVLDVTYSGNSYRGNTATIRVDEVIKGEVNTEIVVDRFGDGPDCRSVITRDDVWIFFITRNKEPREDRLVAHYTFPWDATAPATDANIDTAKLGALHGTSIFLPSLKTGW